MRQINSNLPTINRDGFGATQDDSFLSTSPASN